MAKLEEMWAALAAYQPQADAAGHGDSWAKMCSSKTAYAAFADAAAYAAEAAAYAATDAADAAGDAAYADANADADAAEMWAREAIDRINKVLVKPAQPALAEQEVDINRLNDFYFTYPGGDESGPYLLKSDVAALWPALLAAARQHRNQAMNDKELLNFVEQQLFHVIIEGVATLDHIGYTDFAPGSWAVSFRADEIARLLDLAKKGASHPRGE